VQHRDGGRDVSGLARFGVLGRSGLSPDTVVATEEGEVIIDRPAIREPDLGVRGERQPRRGIQPKPRLRGASGQEKPGEADTGIFGNARLWAGEGDHWIEYVLVGEVQHHRDLAFRVVERFSAGVLAGWAGRKEGPIWERPGWRTAGLWMLSGSSGSILADMTRDLQRHHLGFSSPTAQHHRHGATSISSFSRPTGRATRESDPDFRHRDRESGLDIIRGGDVPRRRSAR
jgi:hypothetical protein